ncbi:MAG: RluA family pseudouridine synthase [Wenzhouxiangellaceae bacterium]
MTITSEDQNQRRVEGSAVVPQQLAGQRLDQVAAELFADYSRSQLQQWIKSGELLVDQRPGKRSQRLVGGEQLTLQARLEAHDEHRAEAIPLDILYQDDDLLVINKPAGLVVHPAAGNWSGTLQNALLHFDPELAVMPRAGIIHRLDKETSGALLVARNPAVRQALVEALQAREVERRYIALVWGRPPATATVDAPIGRHPRQRTRMTVLSSGKPAVTHLRREAVWQHACKVEARLETGRTHQIRVHCSHLGYPLVGDPVYGRRKPPAGLAPELAAMLATFQRQALHAWRLALDHPRDGQRLEIEAPVATDLAELIAACERYDAV